LLIELEEILLKWFGNEKVMDIIMIPKRALELKLKKKRDLCDDPKKNGLTWNWNISSTEQRGGGGEKKGLEVCALLSPFSFKR
jgi:hypothetical protein